MFVDGSFSAVIQPAVDDDAEVLAQCMLVCVTAVSLTPDPPPHSRNTLSTTENGLNYGLRG